MDLMALRQDVILIPTPGMTEQAHLAKRYPGVEIGGQTGYASRYTDITAAIRAWQVEDTLKNILGGDRLGSPGNRVKPSVQGALSYPNPWRVPDSKAPQSIDVIPLPVDRATLKCDGSNCEAPS